MPERSRRALLRESTSEAHAALDTMIGPFDTLQSYRSYLVGMASFRRVVENRMSAADWPRALESWDFERFSPLIDEDLRDLRIEAPQMIETPMSPGSVEDFLGMLYVLEGSALGSRLLYKRAQALGYGADFGARHLAVQARPSGRWPAFLKLLEDVEAIDMDRVAAASRATFNIAEKAFRQEFHEPA